MSADRSSSNAGTRERLVESMLGALGSRGFHGIGVAELLADAKAPKGVLYHHFPGGKAELAVAAIDLVVGRIAAALNRLLERHADPATALSAWLTEAQRTLVDSGYVRGCPLATIALESAPDDLAIREAVARGFAAIRAILSGGLLSAGVAPDRAAGLAALAVSAFEGGLIQARVASDPEPLRRTFEMLREVVRSSLPAHSGAGARR